MEMMENLQTGGTMTVKHGTFSVMVKNILAMAMMQMGKDIFLVENI